MDTGQKERRRLLEERRRIRERAVGVRMHGEIKGDFSGGRVIAALLRVERKKWKIPK